MKWALLPMLLVLALGCEDPKTDMGSQPRYTTYQPAETAQFANGASARELPAGVVSNTSVAEPQISIDRSTIEAGQEQFEIFCSVCHGRLGNGQGMIVQRGFTRPPSFHIERLRSAPDEHFYNVITHGYGAMLSYADRVPPVARRQIIAYIRALQSATPGANVEVRRALIAQGDRPVVTTQP